MMIAMQKPGSPVLQQQVFMQIPYLRTGCFIMGPTNINNWVNNLNFGIPYLRTGTITIFQKW